MAGRDGGVVCLRHRCNAADAGDTKCEKIGPHEIDEAFAKKILERARILYVTSETERRYRFLGNFSKRGEIGERARLIEP